MTIEIFKNLIFTGKSLSKALILAATNPQYVKRLFIELQVQYMKTTSSENGENMLCSQIVLNVNTKTKKQFVYTTCSELAVFVYWTCNSMNNLLIYCGLVAARITASDKDLPVQMTKMTTMMAMVVMSTMILLLATT